MARKYDVWHTTSTDDEVIVEFFVTDQTIEESDRDFKWKKNLDLASRVNYMHQERTRPRVATFPVSALYDEETQRNRAKMLCDYMNKINDAMEQAKAQTALIDLISAQAPTNSSN